MRTMKASVALTLLAGAILTIAVKPAAAESFVLSATGMITAINDPNGVLDSSVFVGQSYSEFFVFDTNATPFSSGTSTELYPGTFGVLSVGDYTVVPIPNAFANFNGLYVTRLTPPLGTGDMLEPSLGGNVSQNDIAQSALVGDGGLRLFDKTGTLFSSTAFPDLSAFNLSNFSRTSFTGQIYTQSQTTFGDFSGNIQALTVTPLAANTVPEPGSLSLLSLGLGGVLLAVYRRRQA